MTRDKRLHLDRAYNSKKARASAYGFNYYTQHARKNKRGKAEQVLPVRDYFRWIVERTHSWINRFRRVYFRWDKKVDNYLAMLQFAAAIIVFNQF